MKITAKSAFSLVEMIVVIGIIGILAAVLLSQFTGATESARTAQCSSNIRNLAQALQTYAMQQEDGYYPPAESFVYKAVNVKSYKLAENKRVGWISGSEENDSKSVSYVPFYSENQEQIRYAITNGASGKMWQIVGGSAETYRCPVHAEACRKANGHLPGWSYAMNRYFGYNKGDKNQRWMGVNMTGVGNPEKRLLLAEIQGATINDKINGIQITPKLSSGGKITHGVLDYETDTIGFNHKVARGRYAGHVAFADGHVEKIMCPVSGISSLELTKALCEAHELSYDGKSYKDLSK